MNISLRGKSSHRNDIDGLRAIAVLLVVSFHTGVAAFNGGYVGVDIFFVISGYLLTGIIMREIDRDEFSILKFYDRRVRRIVPALVAMLLVCSIASYYFLLPKDLVHFGQSLSSALLSYSNIYFWTQTGYFKPSFAKVLLHTWSLGVEEQFYLFLPLTLLAFRKKRSWLTWALAAAAVISLSIAQLLIWRRNPDAAFYLPVSRAWELLIGSLIALEFVPSPKGRLWREIAAALGVISIALAACLYSPETPFPGLFAFLPCVGAALLLMTGSAEGTACSRLLSIRPLVFIGLISYSIYLWHWPLITFAKMGGIQGVTDKGLSQKLAVFVLSILLGWLSWRFVEQPFRRPGTGLFSAHHYGTLLAAGCVVLAVAGACIFTRGFPGRFSPTAARAGSYLDATEEMRIGTCFITSANHFKDFQANTCVAADQNRPNYLLIGDSHAAALWFGLDHALKQSRILEATSSGCSPLLGNYDSSDCGDMRKFIYESLLSHIHVNGVILTEHWQSANDIRQIEPTIKWLEANNIRVYVVGPVQEYDAPLPMLVAFALKRRDPTLPDRHLLPGVDRLDKFLQEKATEWHVVYLSPWQQLCGPGHCPAFSNTDEDIPMLSDTNHLTNAGSLLLAQEWVKTGALR
jgi:peptidoglycan/LPS O-acetylase OafA/YrhL